MNSIKNPMFGGLGLMLFVAAYGCSLPDVKVETRSQSQNSERPSDDGWRPPAHEADAATPMTPEADASSNRGEHSSADAAVDAGAGAAGSQATDSRPPAAVGGSGAAVANSAGAAGCSDPACGAATPECQSAEDCVKLGPEYKGGRCASTLCLPNSRWRCEPPPTASGSETRQLTLPVIDALALKVLPNVKIVACNKGDLVCMEPVAEATTDMDGKATLTVPANFAGYMQQTERSDYTPAMYFTPAQIPADGLLSNFPLVPSASFGGLAIALGTSVDRSRGHAMLIAEDCDGTALSGITFTSPQVDDATTQFYVRDQIPTDSATDTPPEGDGGYVNLTPGVVEITATDKKTGLVLNTITVLIRAGATTTVYIRPAARGTGVVR